MAYFVSKGFNGLSQQKSFFFVFIKADRYCDNPSNSLISHINKTGHNYDFKNATLFIYFF